MKKWIKVSWRHFTYFLLTRRGIALILIGFVLNVLMTYTNVAHTSWAIEGGKQLSPSIINYLRDCAERNSMLFFIWMLTFAYEGAYLFSNGLFQRFLLNGFKRWQWGHWQLFSAFFLSLSIGFLQTLLINSMGDVLYGIQLLSFGYTFKLAVNLLFTSSFVLFVVALLPTRLVLFLVLGWKVIEEIIGQKAIDQKLFNIPSFLPFNNLNEWLDAPYILEIQGIVLIAYFILFLTLFYLFINKRSYG